MSRLVMYARGVAVCIAIACGTVACSSGSSFSSSTPTRPAGPSVPYADEAACPGAAQHVVYEARGGDAEGTYATPSGTEQRPFIGASKSVEGCFPPGAFTYLSLQLRADSGSIRCTITVDGFVVSDNTSRGAYAIASCSS